jgi:hypothetical protein
MSDTLQILRDVISAVFMLTGSLLALVSSIGLFRFSSTRARMHATTKPATLGVLLCAVGAAAQFGVKRCQIGSDCRVAVGRGADWRTHARARCGWQVTSHQWIFRVRSGSLPVWFV